MRLFVRGPLLILGENIDDPEDELSFAVDTLEVVRQECRLLAELTQSLLDGRLVRRELRLLIESRHL